MSSRAAVPRNFGGASERGVESTPPKSFRQLRGDGWGTGVKADPLSSAATERSGRMERYRGAKNRKPHRECPSFSPPSILN